MVHETNDEEQSLQGTRSVSEGATVLHRTISKADPPSVTDEGAMVEHGTNEEESVQDAPSTTADRTNKEEESVKDSSNNNYNEEEVEHNAENFMKPVNRHVMTWGRCVLHQMKRRNQFKMMLLDRKVCCFN